MVRFDLSNSTNRVMSAKKRNVYNTAYGRTRDGIKYKSRTGRGVSHEREERLAKQKKVHGGPRLYKNPSADGAASNGQAKYRRPPS